MSAFVFALGILPVVECLCWRLLRGSILLIPGKKTDVCMTDRRGKKVKNTLCCLGQAQGTQAVQRQSGLELSASHKAEIPPRKKNKNAEGFAGTQK